jgi:phenylacetate-CoA oxygenase PaaH subunit
MATDQDAARSRGPILAPDRADDIYEVFRQERDGEPMRHAGNVRAPDQALAVHYAREFYGRRQESARLWVIRRDAIQDLDDVDWLQPPLDRSFKKPGGYVMREKLELARRRATEESGAAEQDGARTSAQEPG